MKTQDFIMFPSRHSQNYSRSTEDRTRRRLGTTVLGDGAKLTANGSGRGTESEVTP